MKYICKIRRLEDTKNESISENGMFIIAKEGRDGIGELVLYGLGGLEQAHTHVARYFNIPKENVLCGGIYGFGGRKSKFELIMYSQDFGSAPQRVVNAFGKRICEYLTQSGIEVPKHSELVSVTPSINREKWKDVEVE